MHHYLLTEHWYLLFFNSWWLHAGLEDEVVSVLVVLVDTVIIHCSTVPLTANCVCGGGLLASTLLCIVGVLSDSSWFIRDFLNS